jgi:formylglycine-generating enzyme required for sulfatase activity
VQVPTVLTHDFEIQQHELTIGEWNQLGFPVRVSTVECQQDDCPLGGASWFHVATYANVLSVAHDPPLEPCYDVQGCRMYQGSLACGCSPNADGSGRECGTLGMNADTAYECEGYRLPTRAEWQYAARAGTTTTYYSGPMTVTGYQEDHSSECEELRDTNLDPIAWYCVNSGGVTHPVGGKLPNTWGLYDVLGNAFELTHDADVGRSPEPMQQDPFGEIGVVHHGRASMGGSAIGWPSLLRTAGGLQQSPDIGSAMVGVRLARTLGPGKVPTRADLPDASTSE